MNKRRFLTTLAALAATASPLLAGAADNYPAGPVRWVVPYAAGGGTDVIARTLAAPVALALGQTIVVDNKPGANTMLGAQEVSRAKPDGLTVGSADNATLALNQHLYAKLPYNPERDFEFVGGFARFPYALLVHPDVPARTLKELLELARKEPGKLSYGTPGTGGPNHVAMELLQQRTGTRFTHVPYRGAAPGLQDLMGGQIQFMLVDTASSQAYVKAGKLRALAVSYPKRLAAFPDVPTFAEAGVADFSAFSWQGLIAPAGTPKPLITRLNKELVQALSTEAVQRKLADLGVEPAPSSPEEFAALVREQAGLWGKVIRDAQIRLEP
ncbi:tripartite tricarboxylate transporter substrate binding protein [Aquincola sp. MAHUQ-54]|uniref:Tripartite tricarboxylate transporter substrate binding protein n=1 Tax=Aquincola agrisoli TaxID=3119538 RepID=A0AAW9QCX2_9BURK